LVAGKVVEPAGKVVEPTGKVVEPVGKVEEPAGKVVEPAREGGTVLNDTEKDQKLVWRPAYDESAAHQQ